MTEQTIGKWDPAFPLQNVAVHASLLPNRKVLYWGRRSDPSSMDVKTLDEQITCPFLLDPQSTKSTPTDLPKTLAGANVNLFCSGHAIQPDGSVLVVGGHISDGMGAQQACVYKPSSNKWTAKTLPNNGRWYPSVLTLADGSMLAISGSFDKNYQVDNIPQVWRNEAWLNVTSPPVVSALYPRLHLTPDGRIFEAGTLAQSQMLSIDGPGAQSAPVGIWSADQLPARANKERQYGCSVAYDSGKVIWIGGGNEPVAGANGIFVKDDAGQFTGAPTAATETIDLNQTNLEWKTSAPMHFPRRQHNATTLPDGTVLVTGGTQGPGFNDLNTANTVHTAELWNPATGQWTTMAKETSDRCYHSIALLLPTGQVLSAGSGEYQDGMGTNAKMDAQIFSPPYLFKGSRPVVSTVLKEVTHDQEFDVTMASSDAINKVTWIRLGSVTHSMNLNQGVVIQKLSPPQNSKVTVKVPVNNGFVSRKSSAASPGFAPPGHYMLFFVNTQGVPSEATIVHISLDPLAKKADPPKPVKTTSSRMMPMAQLVAVSLPELDEQIIAEQQRPAVAVGLTPVCPYGLGPCWAGASEGLRAINDIEVVRPVPDQANCVAFVHLKKDVELPDIDVWRKEFASTANGSYGMRGIQMTISGEVEKPNKDTENKLVMAGTATRPEVRLAPFQADSNINWDFRTHTSKPVTDAEIRAYAGLCTALAEDGAGPKVQVTGTLHKRGANGFSLDVRSFEL